MLVQQKIHVNGHFALADGTLIPSNGGSVEIEQLGSGRTFLYVDKSPGRLDSLPHKVNRGVAVSFLGVTEKGLRLRTSDLQGYLGQDASRDCFSLSSVMCGDRTAAYSSIELSLTNVIFRENGGKKYAFHLEVDGTPIEIELLPKEDYVKLVLALRQTDCPTVTAILRLTVENLSLEALDAFVDDLCTALSVVQGRKIQWIHRAAYSADGTIVWSEFGETKTKNYTHGLLCFNPDTRKGIEVSLENIPSVFPAVRAFHQMYDPHRRIVNSWLDARLQADFLEARTLKYAVVLEALCQMVLSNHGDIPSTYVSKSIWRATRKQFLPQIKAHLEAYSQNDPAHIEDVCSSANWGNVNRIGFRMLLAHCLRKLAVSMHDQEKRIRRVTDVRNKIVHSFCYLSDGDFEELKWPTIDQKQQHFLVACFVEEMLLRLFALKDQISASWVANFEAHRL